MSKKIKPKYHIPACLSFMLRTAWKRRKRVIFLCLALAFAGAGKSIVDLLITPAILYTLDHSADLPRLIITILGFSFVSFFLFFMNGYLNRISKLPRSNVRIAILRKISHKGASTSYVNTLEDAFLNMQTEAYRCASVSGNSLEHIWEILTTMMVKCICFIFYILLIFRLHPLLSVVIFLVSVIGYFNTKYLRGWNLRHKEETASLSKEISYLKQVSTDRQYAKELRSFGLKAWLDDLMDSAIRLQKAWVLKREKEYIWFGIADLLLTFLRDGIAYGYLLWKALSIGMSVEAFLLYFSAISSLTQLLKGFLLNLLELHRDCLDISTIQEYLNWPEPFLFENGAPIPAASSYELCLDHVSYRYPKTEKDALVDVSLTIHPGERVAVVGDGVIIGLS